MMVNLCVQTVDEASKYLASRNNILIITHKSPDGDTVGSAAALCLALRSLGKNVYLFGNRGFTKNQNAYIKSLCAGEDFTPECVCAVDIADIKLLPGGAEIYVDRIDIAIDHHLSHKSFAKRLILDTNAAACGEIVYKIIKNLGIPITAEIAEALYVAVSTDTSCFLNSNTTAETHRIAAELLSHPFDFARVNREFFIVKSRERLDIETRLLSGMRFYMGGKVAVIVITHDMLRETQADEDDLNNIAALARSVAGVELGILIREREENECKVSMRSSEKIDVAKLCERFDGGGHSRAAGCTVKLPCQETEKTLIEALKEYPMFAEDTEELTV
ncbi:MAG: bifunctional oligoribonuclease/PAP phosphatase NrnA [Clostridiales bacterium]|jgi:phosphoesterase RecJ-like protein|nr:bifunctional oligoribonuclease/PAP phosphatase NrnA [Clostridiales bacterium]